MKDDSYEAKLERAEYELWVKKIPRKKSHPLLFKLLRFLGVRVRLPHYASPVFAFTFCTFYIAVLVAALLLFVQNDAQSISVVSIAFKAIPVGMVFGVIMMLINVDNMKNLQLTPWKDI